MTREQEMATINAADKYTEEHCKACCHHSGKCAFKGAEQYCTTLDVRHESFMDGYVARQPEIDTLTAKITQLEADCERYRTDIAEGLKREEIARKEIEEKRRERQ